MKKTTFRTLFTIIALLLCFALAFTLVACNNNDDKNDTKQNEEKSDFTSLISNGDFSSSGSSTKEPASVTSWSTYTPSGSDSSKSVAGIISTGTTYDAQKSNWGGLANPAGKVVDNKLLMIYNKEANSYGYYATFSSTAGAYYSISVKVQTANLEGNAHIYVSCDNGFADWAIGTTTNAETYTYYVQAPLASSATITVRLTLGYGVDKASGYVFFDDVVATKISSTKYAEAKEAAGAKDKFVSLAQPDGEFDYYTNDGSTTLYTPSGWSTTNGKDKEGTTLTTSYTKRGILNTSNENWDSDTYSTNPNVPNGDDKNVLVIKNGAYAKSSTSGEKEYEYKATATGYTAKQQLQIGIAAVYKISVFVNSTIDNKGVNDEHKLGENVGAAFKLVGTDDYIIDTINTNGTWQEVTFYILGNDYRPINFNVSLWLGTDKDESYYTQGIAFFDKLTITKIEGFASNERATTLANYQMYESEFVKVIDLASKNGNLIENNNFETLNGWDFAEAKDLKPLVENKDILVTTISKAELDGEWTAELKARYGIESNPKYPHAFAPVLIVNHLVPTAYTMTQSNTVEIKQNVHYRLSVWIKTFGLDDDAKVKIDLLNKEGTSLSSFTVNTAEYENELTNDYAEYVFYIQGANANLLDEDNTNEVKVQISLGSGTAYDPTSYEKGGYCIANINMEQVTYTEYQKASSGTYTNTKSFASNSATITNGNFNTFDLKSEDIDQTTGLVNTTNDYATAGISSWTDNSSNYGTEKLNEGTENEKKVNKLIAGVININNGDTYLSQFGLSKSDILNSTWDSSVDEDTQEKASSFGAPNYLMLTTRGTATVSPYTSNAIKSPSMSLSANSYYMCKFYAKAFAGTNQPDSATKATVYLTTTSTNVIAPYYSVANTDGWVEYVFAVETGMSSVTAYFEIYYGDKKTEENKDDKFSGTILFDSFNYTSIDKDKFTALSEKDSSKTTKFTTVTFDSTSAEGSAVSPSGFSGTGSSSSSSSINNDSQVAGVISKDNYKWDGNKLGIYTTETTTDDAGNETTKDVIKTGSELDASAIFTNDGMEDGDTVGNYILLINNRKSGYYTYSTTSLTLASESYYVFNAYVRTAMLEKGKAAKVFVTANDETYTFEVNTSTYDDEGKETLGAWKKISFLIKNEKKESISSTYLKFALGASGDGNGMQGYLFIDNVSMSSISEEAYTTLSTDYNADNTKLVTFEVVENNDDDKDDNKDDKKPAKDKLNTTLLWTYITSIAIAVVLIAVIIIWLVKKYAPRKKTAKAKAASYDKKHKKDKSTDADEPKNGTARDEYKD